MAIEELLCVLVYPLSLVLVLGFRIMTAHAAPDAQISRKVAQASYWGEYADQHNASDRNQILLASVLPPREVAPIDDHNFSGYPH